MADGKILIVEDDEALRETLTLLLSLEDYDVSVACNGKEALDILESENNRISLLLTDLDMPIMNGWQLLELKNANQRLSQIPVIVVSAGERGMAQGSDFLAKPFEAQTLLSMIRSRIMEAQPQLLI